MKINQQQFTISTQAILENIGDFSGHQAICYNMD